MAGDVAARLSGLSYTFRRPSRGLGADNGNRTHLRGLGSRRSADELYPRYCPAGITPGHRSENGERVLTGHAWKVGEYYVRHPRRWWAKPELNRENRGHPKTLFAQGVSLRRVRTIFAHTVWSWRLPFGRPAAAVREVR